MRDMCGPLCGSRNVIVPKAAQYRVVRQAKELTEALKLTW